MLTTGAETSDGAGGGRSVVRRTRMHLAPILQLIITSPTYPSTHAYIYTLRTPSCLYVHTRIHTCICLQYSRERIDSLSVSISSLRQQLTKELSTKLSLIERELNVLKQSHGYTGASNGSGQCGRNTAQSPSHAPQRRMSVRSKLESIQVSVYDMVWYSS